MYQEIKDQKSGLVVGILRMSDGAYIPLSDGNVDYQAYQTWYDYGNRPDPDINFSSDAVKDRKWSDIKIQRDSRKAGGVQVGYYWFHTDDTSRIQWLGIKDTARDMQVSGSPDTTIIPMLGQNLLWKTMSGQFVPVTIKTAYQVNQAVKDMDAALFALAEKKRQELIASSTPEDYDTSVGWPLTYTEATHHIAA
jgi:hypothetical protein